MHQARNQLKRQRSESHTVCHKSTSAGHDSLLNEIIYSLNAEPFGPSPFDLLPDELLLMILAKWRRGKTVHDLRLLACVCKRFRRLVYYAELWDWELFASLQSRDVFPTVRRLQRLSNLKSFSVTVSGSELDSKVIFNAMIAAFEVIPHISFLRLEFPFFSWVPGHLSAVMDHASSKLVSLELVCTGSLDESTLMFDWAQLLAIPSLTSLVFKSSLDISHVVSLVPFLPSLEKLRVGSVGDNLLLFSNPLSPQSSRFSYLIAGLSTHCPSLESLHLHCEVGFDEDQDDYEEWDCTNLSRLTALHDLCLKNANEAPLIGLDFVIPLLTWLVKIDLHNCFMNDDQIKFAGGALESVIITADYFADLSLSFSKCPRLASILLSLHLDDINKDTLSLQIADCPAVTSLMTGGMGEFSVVNHVTGNDGIIQEIHGFENLQLLELDCCTIRRYTRLQRDMDFSSSLTSLTLKNTYATASDSHLFVDVSSLRSLAIDVSAAFPPLRITVSCPALDRMMITGDDPDDPSQISYDSIQLDFSGCGDILPMHVDLSAFHNNSKDWWKQQCRLTSYMREYYKEKLCKNVLEYSQICL